MEEDPRGRASPLFLKKYFFDLITASVSTLTTEECETRQPLELTLLVLLLLGMCSGSYNSLILLPV